MKKHYLKIVAVSFVLLLFGAGIVIAQQNSDNGELIKAAYHKKTGALRIVGDKKLKPNEIALSWNERGPRGEDGICPTDSEAFGEILARLDALEEAVANMPGPGDDFVSTTRTVTYGEINLEILGQYTEITPLAKVSLDPDNDIRHELRITSKEAGFETIWLTNYPSEEVDLDNREYAVIEADVKEDGTMDLVIFPWTEGAFRDVTLADLNLGDVSGMEISQPGVVIIDDSFMNIFGTIVFARSQGETTLAFTSSEGDEASIDIAVDANRRITSFVIYPSDRILPPPPSEPELFISYSIINWDTPHEVYFPGTYDWNPLTAPSLSADLIIVEEGLIQALEPDLGMVEFSILSERDWDYKWPLSSYTLTGLTLNASGDLKIDYPQDLSGGIYVEVDVNSQTISASYQTPPECTENAVEECYGGPAGTAGVGLCQAGTRTCGGGEWGDCVGQILPETETCDGLDNDCDGTADETWLQLGDICSAELGGTGTYVCSLDGSGIECAVTDYCSPNPCNDPPKDGCASEYTRITYLAPGSCMSWSGSFECSYDDYELIACGDGQICSGGACIDYDHCTDDIQNYGETDTDCGGSCVGCAYGLNCDFNSDCLEGFCEGNVCI